MATKIKLLTALAALLIAAAGVMTFEACNKKDKDSVEPAAQNNRMPLATFDHNCFVGTCVPLDQEVALGCSPCHITDEQHWCETHISGSGGGDTPWLGIISIILGIIGIIVDL